MQSPWFGVSKKNEKSVTCGVYKRTPRPVTRRMPMEKCGQTF